MVLFKVRVVMLLLFAAMGGACLAAGGWPGTGNVLLLLVTGGLAAGGASAINQYLERDLDGRMERTRNRPLAGGSSLASRWALYAGALMILMPVGIVFFLNPALAVFVLLGAIVYVLIYTVWLKRRTPLNTVIGGAAGSAAVLSGSAAAGFWNEPGALALALLVFLWTPTHFWSLAIAYRNDYARGGFPMLPVQTSLQRAAGWVMLHTMSAGVVALALAAHPALGWLYVVPVALSLFFLIVLNIRLIRAPGRKQALALFHASNLFLAVVLLAICASTLLS
jgi:protoheme IX farnesyltransferase